jgi:hypothetical protein
MKDEIVFMNQIKQNGWNKFIYMNFDHLDQIELLNWIDHNGSTRKLLMRSMEHITRIMFMAFVTWMTIVSWMKTTIIEQVDKWMKKNITTLMKLTKWGNLTTWMKMSVFHRWMYVDMFSILDIYLSPPRATNLIPSLPSRSTYLGFSPPQTYILPSKLTFKSN